MFVVVWPFLEQLGFAALDTGKNDLAQVRSRVHAFCRAQTLINIFTLIQCHLYISLNAILDLDTMQSDMH